MCHIHVGYAGIIVGQAECVMVQPTRCLDRSWPTLEFPISVSVSALNDDCSSLKFLSWPDTAGKTHLTLYFTSSRFINYYRLWRSGVAVARWSRSTRSKLVLRWMTVSGFSYRCRTFISVCNQPARPTQPSIPPGSVPGPASVGKAKTGTVHCVSGWTQGVQVKLWDRLRTRAIPDCLCYDEALFKSTYVYLYRPFRMWFFSRNRLQCQPNT